MTIKAIDYIDFPMENVDEMLSAQVLRNMKQPVGNTI